MGEDVKKTLARLKSSYELYEKTKKESREILPTKLLPDGSRQYSDEDIEKNLELLNNAQQDVIDTYVQYGGDIADLGIKTKEEAPKKRRDTSIEDIDAQARKVMEESKKYSKEVSGPTVTTRIDQEYIPAKGTYDSQEAFDVIPLPSKGEGYKEKISRVSVAYLTAYDENMIVSPNLYRDNLILDYLIQEKLLSQEIDPLDLLEGDRDAIVLFLRENGYGVQYPITAVDDVTGKEFDAVVDLSKLNYKKFDLVGDTNGWFPFTLPVSGAEVKFRFPTHRDTLILQKMQEAEEPNIMKETIKNYVSTLDKYAEEEKILSNEDKVKLRKAIRTIDNWGRSMGDENSKKFNHSLTNRLNLLVMSVNGITSREYISNFISKMNVKDSSALRRYMTKNEPGIDYTITVERPEELGGGSMTTFLQLDQFLFLNIAE